MEYSLNFIKRNILAALLFTLAMTAIATGCGSGPAAGTGATRMAPAAPQAASTVPGANYTFAVCGDNRTEGIGNGTLTKIIQSAKAKGAAFIVDTGDVSNVGNRVQLTEYLKFTQNAGIRFYTVPGNHDVGKGGVSDAYASVIGAYYYSFNYGGDHYLVADNADDSTGIDGKQMSWIETDLAANRDKRHQFIFAHIPVASPTLDAGHVTGEGSDAGLESGKQLAQLAENTPNVADLFFGHIHAYIPYRIGNLPAYITGGAGAPLYGTPATGGYYHYLLVTVTAAGISVEVVRV
jgi:3',5'-cyclic AMP phosphodiesterase CpdA